MFIKKQSDFRASDIQMARASIQYCVSGVSLYHRHDPLARVCCVCSDAGTCPRGEDPTLSLNKCLCFHRNLLRLNHWI